MGTDSSGSARPPEYIFRVTSALSDLPTIPLKSCSYHSVSYHISLKHILCLICRWTHVGYAEMGGVGNEEEAAARMSAALGLPSYPLPVNETLRLCTWLKSQPASSGYLGEQASLKPNMKSQPTLTCLLFGQPQLMYLHIYNIYTIYPHMSCCLDTQNLCICKYMYKLTVCVYICVNT